jgi:hypothetical protein
MSRIAGLVAILGRLPTVFAPEVEKLDVSHELVETAQHLERLAAPLP